MKPHTNFCLECRKTWRKNRFRSWKQTKQLKQHCRTNHYVSEDIRENLVAGDWVVFDGIIPSNIKYFPNERKIVLERVPLRAPIAGYATVECCEYEPHMFIVTVVPEEQGHWVRYAAEVSDSELMDTVRDLLDWTAV